LVGGVFFVTGLLLGSFSGNFWVYLFAPLGFILMIFAEIETIIDALRLKKPGFLPNRRLKRSISQKNPVSGVHFSKYSYDFYEVNQ
jgi:hypothetical protein